VLLLREARMLTIWKLGVGAEDYYLDKVAKGAEDYYSGDGELAGRWMGRGASRLGLRGEVAPEQLRGLMAGVDPASGDRLAGRPGARHVAGWDMMFAAPKSVSVLYALGGDRVVAEVAGAHDTAVAAGLAYLEAHAVASRRRVGDEIVAVRGEGLVVAAFRHRTSRAGDPHLHTHALAVNAVERIDGGWGALHSPIVYRHARTAGFVYQAVLRGELTERLGVRWDLLHNGYAEIEGIDRQLLEAFSKRHTEIQAAMAERGEDSARAADIAQRRTRTPKAAGVDPETLHARWENEARTLGFDPDHVVAGVGGWDEPTVTTTRLQQVIEQMVSPTGLTLHQASFDRRDVMRAWCEDLPAGTKVTLPSLEGLVDDMLQLGAVVPIMDSRARLRGPEVLFGPDGTITTSSVVERRWSTTELLAVEQELLDTANSSKGRGVGRLSDKDVDQHLARRGDLSDEQTAMVRQITTSGDGVEVVVGRAGTGKTYALAAAARVWRAGGYQPIGLGLAARVAYELETSAGIPSTTVEQFLIDLDQAPNGILHRRNVIIVDEAGMVDTRRLADVVDHAQRPGAKVVLVGDHHQLPAVEAGGAFAALVARIGAVELTENRRQHEIWERDMLARLRTGAGGRGGVAEVVAIYGEHSRVHIGATPADVRAAMVADWYGARQQGDHVVMIALRRRDVAELNCRARSLLVDDGAVAAEGVTVGDKTFAVGDRVVCLDGDRRLGVHNALFGAIIATDELGTVAVCAEESSRVIELPHWYLEDRHLDHAYATTIHKAQGATYDRVLLLGDDRLYRQAGYTGLSRGRDRNDLYIVAADDRDHDPELERHSQTPEDDEPLERLIKGLHRDGAKLLATDERDIRKGWGSARPLAEQWTERDQLADWFKDYAPLDRSNQLAETEQSAATIGSAAAQAALARAAAEERLHQLSATSSHQRRAEHELRAASQKEQRLEAQRRELVEQRADLTTQRHARTEWFEQHSAQIERLVELNDSIRYRTQLAARSAEVDRPEHLVAILGEPPVGLEGRHRWRQAGGAIESYRARWGTMPGDTRAAPAPSTSQQAHFLRVRQLIEATTDESSLTVTSVPIELA
jgi:conjugative relaxase-like TrwC/TraI family protein